MQVPVSVGDSILVDSLKDNILLADSVIEDTPNINTVTLESIPYGRFEFMGVPMVSGNIVVTPTLEFGTPVDVKTYFVPEVNLDSNTPIDTLEKKMENNEAKPKPENNKTPLTKLFFEWMGTVPVYRLLKESIRIK